MICEQVLSINQITSNPRSPERSGGLRGDQGSKIKQKINKECIRKNILQNVKENQHKKNETLVKTQRL